MLTDKGKKEADNLQGHNNLTLKKDFKCWAIFDLKAI